MNKTNVFWSPRVILSGPGAVKRIGVEARGLGADKVLIVTDKGVSGAGLLKKVRESLEKEGLQMEVFDEVEPEPGIRTVELCTRIIEEKNYDLIVGLGGGSSMDVAKAASVAVKIGGSIRDYLGMDKIPKPGLSKLLIPTTAGTGSEASRAVVLVDETDGTKKVAYSTYLLPDIAVVDPLMTVTMPPKVTVDTGMDALVHAIEAYTSVNANLHTDLLALKAIELIGGNLRKTFANGKNIETRYNMAMASLFAGMSFTGAGLGAVHALAYPLSTEYNLTHGRSNAVILPHVMDFNKISNLSKFRDIARAMGEQIRELSLREAAEKSVIAVKKLIRDLEMQERLRDYGVPEKALSELAESGFKSGIRLLPNNPRSISLEESKEIYKRAW